VQNSWLWLCFFVSCYFYGTQLNPLLLISGIAGPLAVIAATPAARLAALSRHAPVLFWGSLAAAVLIVLHQLFLSTSPGTSFFPSLILACLPLWAVTVALLKDPWRFWVGVSVVVAAFAASSAAEFVWLKQRAHAPFLDPANYLTLLYLVAIPWVVLGLKRGLSNELVISPYASALALMVAPRAAAENLQLLDEQGVLGRFGYYDAVDYTRTRLPRDKSHAPVPVYMAHHSGMTFLSLAHALKDQPMQRRFMANPWLKSTELLLQERAPTQVEPVYPHAAEARGFRATLANMDPKDPTLWRAVWTQASTGGREAPSRLLTIRAKQRGDSVRVVVWLRYASGP